MKKSRIINIFKTLLSVIKINIVIICSKIIKKVDEFVTKNYKAINEKIN